MNFGNAAILAFAVNPANALTIYLTGCPSHPLCRGEQPPEVAVTRGLLRGRPGRTEGPSLHCILTSFVDRPHTTEGTGQQLVSSRDPLAQRYQRETFTNPEG